MTFLIDSGLKEEEQVKEIDRQMKVKADKYLSVYQMEIENRFVSYRLMGRIFEKDCFEVEVRKCK